MSLTDNEDAGSEEVCCTGQLASCHAVFSAVAHISSMAEVLCHA